MEWARVDLERTEESIQYQMLLGDRLIERRNILKKRSLEVKEIFNFDYLTRYIKSKPTFYNSYTLDTDPFIDIYGEKINLEFFGGTEDLTKKELGELFFNDNEELMEILPSIFYLRIPEDKPLAPPVIPGSSLDMAIDAYAMDPRNRVAMLENRYEQTDEDSEFKKFIYSQYPSGVYEDPNQLPAPSRERLAREHKSL
jgi:hypothetical protein